MRRATWILVGLFTLAVLPAAHGDDPAPAPVHLRYLMRLHATLDPSSDINRSLSIVNVASDGSWFRGPRLRGTIVPPGGDWSRVLSSGVMRLDVRLTLRTEDGGLIAMQYNGVFQDSAHAEDALRAGGTLGAHDVRYWMIAPTFETDAPAYRWLNRLQALGKMVAYREGKSGYVEYDLYAAY